VQNSEIKDPRLWTFSRISVLAKKQAKKGVFPKTPLLKVLDPFLTRFGQFWTPFLDILKSDAEYVVLFEYSLKKGLNSDLILGPYFDPPGPKGSF
jgi:hypothetical protein